MERAETWLSFLSSEQVGSHSQKQTLLLHRSRMGMGTGTGGPGSRTHHTPRGEGQVTAGELLGQESPPPPPLHRHQTLPLGRSPPKAKGGWREKPAEDTVFKNRHAPAGPNTIALISGTFWHCFFITSIRPLR